MDKKGKGRKGKTREEMGWDYINLGRPTHNCTNVKSKDRFPSETFAYYRVEEVQLDG